MATFHSNDRPDGVDIFISAARAYCAIIDAAHELPRGELVWRLGPALSNLYAAAVALPSPGAPFEEPADFDVQPASQIRYTIHDRLGKVDSYRRVFDPFVQLDKSEPLEVSLSDDLADVYVQVKSAAEALATNSQRSALWNTRFAFDHHWGVHASAAIYVLHWLTRQAGEQWVSPDSL